MTAHTSDAKVLDLLHEDGAKLLNRLRNPFVGVGAMAAGAQQGRPPVLAPIFQKARARPRTAITTAPPARPRTPLGPICFQRCVRDMADMLKHVASS